jgi:ligand-binding sensor domain-containing protein
MRGGAYRLALKGTKWESIGDGLDEAEVKSFLIHQDTVYAGTGTGVYRWVEGKKQWVTVGVGLDRILVPGLAMMDDGKLLAATSGKGLFHFDTQQSQTPNWVDSHSKFVDPLERLPHRYLRVIAVNKAQHIFLGTQNGGIFRSTDRGQSWSSLSRNLPNDSIRSIVPDHEDVIVATGQGIFRWKHEQQTWIGINTGLTKLAIQSLTMTESGELYAGTSSGAFRSEDGGAHWTDISQGFGVQLAPKGPYD